MNKMLRILLIEDNPGDARLIEEMLKESGIEFRLECVTSLSSGIEEVRLDGFSVILLDLGLPDSQGLGTLTKLNEIKPEAPIIVLTGLADEEMGTKAVKEGAQDYLIKGQLDHHLLSKSIKYSIERTKLETALRESNELFSLFMHHSPIYAFIKEVTPTESRVLQASDNFQQMIGISGRDMLGKTMAELFPAEFAAKITADDRAVVTNGKLLKLDEDLNGRNYTSIKFPIAHGDRILLAGYTIDITERKQLEESIKAQTKRFEAFFDNSITPLAFLDKDFNFIRVNKAYADATQREISDFPGHNHFEFYPSDARTIFEDVVRTKTAFQAFARPFVFPDHPEWGVTYWNWTLVPILDKNGEVEFLAFSLVDVTKQQKSEQERERLNKELEQILYAASHDLKTPLVNINGYTGEVKQSIESIMSLIEREDISSEARKEIASLAKEFPEAFGFISTSVSRMDTLLNGLLQFSRSGKVDLKIEAIDMNMLLSGILSDLNYRLKEAGADFEVADLPQCAGDSQQITRIFTNLIENAVKYLDPARKGKIKVTGWIKDNLSIYCVEDNGIGIAAEHQKQIFHIFHQLDPSKTGEGLGLAIVQRMAERHGGKVWLESEAGKGSKFFVALPQKQ